MIFGDFGTLGARQTGLLAPLGGWQTTHTSAAAGQDPQGV